MSFPFAKQCGMSAIPIKLISKRLALGACSQETHFILFPVKRPEVQPLITPVCSPLLSLPFWLLRYQDPPFLYRGSPLKRVRTPGMN